MKEVFTYVIQDQTIYDDPLRVRRKLLAATHGRAWTYLHDLTRLKDALRTAEAGAETARTGDNREEFERAEAQVAIHVVEVANLEGLLAEASMAAFDLSPLDPATGEGVTELEALNVLMQYMVFAEGKG